MRAPSFSSRSVVIALCAVAAVSSACADRTRLSPTASEAATLAPVAHTRVTASPNVDLLTVETRYWNPASGLPTGATARATFESLPTNVPGYTNAVVPMPNLARTLESVSPYLWNYPFVSHSDSSWTANRNPGGSHADIGMRYHLELRHPKSVALQFGVDFRGGAIFVDGNAIPVLENWNDPHWGISSGSYWEDVGPWCDVEPCGINAVVWVQSSQVMRITLPAGSHTVDLIGFETAADFGIAASINLDVTKLDNDAYWGDVVGPAVQTPLTVATSGAGQGTVRSAPLGIDCGTTCTGNFPYGSTVTLTPAATGASIFAGWTGACSGTGATCTVEMTMPRTVGATFNAPPALTVQKVGGGTGTVTSSPAGVDCGTACSAGFATGSSVTLTAAAVAPSRFAGWGGACSGYAPTCTVTVNAAATVTADFGGTLQYSGITMETRDWRGTTPTALNADALFGTLPTDHPGYSNAPVPVTHFGNNRDLFTAPNVGEGNYVATRALVNVDVVGGSATVRFYALSDMGIGGVLFIDGVAKASKFPDFEVATTVTLPAGPHQVKVVGYEDCCDGYASLSHNYLGGPSVDATAPMPPPVSLAVSVGTGGGRVTSAPAGIDCGTTCTAAFAAGSQATLTATAAAGFTFTGWSGDCTGSAPTCATRLLSPKSVTATFTPIPVRLNVTVTGNGGGSVSSTPGTIICGVGTCGENFNMFQSVRLDAVPSGISDFTGWSGGGCSGISFCLVTMDQAKTVTATFTKRILSIAVTVTGQGSVTSPAGISCPGDCAETFEVATAVTLTATPQAGWMLAGWTGPCTVSGNTCVTMITAVTNVSAQFTRIRYALNVTKSGTGAAFGTVNSSPPGINCGAACSTTFDEGTAVNLTATTTDPFTTFVGWSGDCVGSSITCATTMTGVRNVQAAFHRTDVTPPVVSCSATPHSLWPANHKLVDVRVTVSVTDAGVGPAGFTLLSVVSDEPDNGLGDGDTANDIQGWVTGTADVAGQLRAERSGGGSGRTYTLTYRGADLAGNTATASCTVFVPKSQKDK